MKNILIAGAGNIGFWYLMAIVSTKIKANIFIYDKSQYQITKFKNRIKLDKKNLNYFTKLKQIPKKLDLVIISTTSTRRYDLTKLISEKYKVKNFIVEKIVERSPKKLVEFLKLSKKINIYVSLPFRASKFFNYIKKIKKKKFKFKVLTNESTLASNGIHFADVASFVLSKKIDNIDTSGVKSWSNGKRKGFKEFFGTLKMEYEKNKVLILINDVTKKKSICSINIDNDRYLIKDYYEKILINNSSIFKSNSLSVSIVMKNEIRKILNKKSTILPTYEKIHANHHIYIKSLLDNYNLLNNRKLRYLPIS